MKHAKPGYTFRALAVLLEYPTQALLDNLDALRTVIADERLMDPVVLRPLFGHLHAADLIDLQSEYVDTFDRGRSTSLLLFEHVHGESRDRGQAMIDLKAQYAQAGLALASTQLPDFLPIFLEYCSVLPRDDAHAAVEEIAHIVASIGRALQRRQSPYAVVFEALAAIAGITIEALPDGADVNADRSTEGDRSGAGAEGHRLENRLEDWMPEAMDAVWAEEPVTFMGACSPQQAQGAQPVVWLDSYRALAKNAAPRRIA